ncbi:MAG: hypothetical protein E7597_00860 [Ruminococcaceae bacterium]|nr:hypothetical protein [Oscillospiraceae bacterium]
MNFKVVYKALLLFSIIAALIAGVFMTVSLLHLSGDDGLNVFHADNGEYYKLVTWIFGVCMVMYVAAIAVLSKRIDKRLDFSGVPSRIAYGAMSFATLGLFGFCIGREAFADGSYDLGNMYVVYTKEAFANVQTTKVSYLYLLFLAVLVGSFAFFTYAFFAKVGEEGTNDNFAAFSMLPSIALAVKIIYDFLLQSGHGYGALYNFHLFGLGFALMFSVYETRFRFKKAAPAPYVFFGLISALSTLIFSIPALVLFFTGKAGANWHPAFCAVDIVIVVYIYIRLFSLKVHLFERQKKEQDIAFAFEGEEEEGISAHGQSIE